MSDGTVPSRELWNTPGRSRRGGGKAWQETLHLETAQAATNSSSNGQLESGKPNILCRVVIGH